jgi:hypothetical protein
VREPDATTLATATSEEKPSARVVLIKGYDRRGSVSCRRHQLGMERGRLVGGLRVLLNGLRSGWQAGRGVSCESDGFRAAVLTI